MAITTHWCNATFVSIPFSLLALAAFAQKNERQPNVILIVTDDQGYGDLGCNGNPWIKTPNIDRLNSESIRFTNFHSATTSAPTRAGLMTGKYCNKVGAWHTVNGRELLDPNEITLAQRMKSAGYSTAIFGKWHLGDSYPFRPQDRGFDQTLTFNGGGVGQQPDYWGNDYFNDTYFRNGKPEKFKGYCTDVWFLEAIKYIRKSKKNPFFCYLALNAPHKPYHVPEKYSAPYKNNPNIPEPDFYGMISNIDENVGILRAALHKMGIAENTILIFMSDNGSSGGAKLDKNQQVISGYNAGMRGLKASNYEGGHRVPLIINLPDKENMQAKEINALSSYIDLMPTILNLCRVKTDSTTQYDGVSLLPLLQGNKWKDRTLVVDTQREEFLVKDKKYAVMTDRWRLNGDVQKPIELYDINTDKAQTKNIASENTEVASTLKNAYQTWWKDVSATGENYNCIQIGSKYEKVVRLNSHDVHTEKGMVAFSQVAVRVGVGMNGFWAIEVMQDGIYEFELCRYPKESKLKMDDEAPASPKISGVREPFRKAKKIVAKSAKIKVGETVQTMQVKNPAEPVRIRLALKAGKTRIQTWLTDIENIERGAYYVYVKLNRPL